MIPPWRCRENPSRAVAGVLDKLCPATASLEGRAGLRRQISQVPTSVATLRGLPGRVRHEI